MKRTTKHVLSTGIAILSAFIAIVSIRHTDTPYVCFGGQDIPCILELGRFDDTTSTYVSGLNYELLKRFGKDRGYNMTIGKAMKEDCYLDSLRNGWRGILVKPMYDSLLFERVAGREVAASYPIDSMTVWVMGSGMNRELNILDNWIDGFSASDDFKKVKRRFTLRYDPFIAASRGFRSSFLGPYDETVRTVARETGWDWVLLCAIIYQESHFKIDAMSYKGAEGLMQVMPQTADRYKTGDLLDPEENIRTGVRHIQRLEGIFSRHSDDPSQVRKFAIAAYNSGEGHILDCIQYARANGLKSDNWDSLSVAVPLICDGTVWVDSLRIKQFDGEQTTGYVKNVYDLYEAFREILGIATENGQ